MIVAGAPCLGALPGARGVLLGLAVAAAAGLMIATSVKLAVPAVHHVVVLGHWRPLGRAGDAPSDLRDSPAGAPIVSSANLYAIAPAARDRTPRFVAPLGHFIAGVPGAAVATAGDVRIELHLRLHGVAGCRTPSRGTLSASPFTPAWCQ